MSLLISLCRSFSRASYSICSVQKWRRDVGSVRLFSSAFPSERKPLALVTGASKSIGLGVAKAFAARGVTVIGMARSESVLREAIDSLPTEHGQKHLALPCDVSDVSQISKAFDIINDTFTDGPHIVVNSAGIVLYCGVSCMCVC